MEDAQNSYDYEADIIGENLHGINAETESNGRRDQETPPDRDHEKLESRASERQSR
jgi:hypothetical protein